MLYKSLNINAKYSLGALRYPLVAYLKITTKCMLNCTFCSQSEEVVQNMDLKFAKAQLLMLKQMGIIQVIYTGGEPLLYPYIHELLRYGSSLKIKQALVTNGLQLFENEMSRCLAYIDNIGISLHGSKDTHNIMTASKTWDSVVDNIIYLHKKFPHLQIDINCTVLPINNNKEDFDVVVNYAQLVGGMANFARLNYIANGRKHNATKEINTMLDYIHHHKYKKVRISNCIIPCVVKPEYKHLVHCCSAGESFFSIEPNGDVKICPSSQIALGNLYINSFEKIWYSKKMELFRQMNWLFLGCKTCSYLSQCKGGCHSEGCKKFWSNNCDYLLLNKLDEVWRNISVKCLKLKYTQVRKEKDSYILLSFPPKMMDAQSFEVCKMLDGRHNGEEIFKHFKNDDIKDMLIAMSIDGILETC